MDMPTEFLSPLCTADGRRWWQEKQASNSHTKNLTAVMPQTGDWVVWVNEVDLLTFSVVIDCVNDVCIISDDSSIYGEYHHGRY